MPANYPSTVASPDTLVDGVDYVEAAWHNELAEETVAIQTELGTDPAGPASDVKTRLNRVLAEDFNTETHSLSATLELTDANLFVQRVDCNGANRTVELAASNDQNHATLIVNTSAGAYTITLKDSTGATTYGKIDKGYSALCLPDGNGGWLINKITPYSYPSPSLGYISDLGAQLTYVSATSYTVSAGSADVNGELLTWAATITRSSLTFTATTMYYVYLYNNSGTPAVEESTTAPVWDSALNYFKKTGDASRRCIGFLYASATDTIAKFVQVISGRNSEFFYVDGVQNFLLNGVNGAASWTSFALTPYVPVHATHFYATPKITNTNSGDDMTLGLSPIDLGSAVGTLAPFTVRMKSSAAGQTTFFGTVWLAIVTASTYYYRTVQNTGAGTGFLAIWGARIVR